jgi:FKBP-type peptidyl-prolyl cis-trans isomerase SlyD
MQIGKDKVVSIDYTLTNAQGEVLDSSKGREALPYLHGASNIIPGLESALEGKSAGDQIRVTVQPDQAYGQLDPALVQGVPRDKFQGMTNIQPGMQFTAQTSHGRRIVTVAKVDEKEITIDANHPLAGVTLTFDVTVKDVREATPEELQHGHAHGAGGHHHH